MATDGVQVFAETKQWARAAGWSVIAPESTGSTNSDAKAQASGLSTKTVFLAEHQSAGRGRNQNTWSDVAGTALLSSWVLPVHSGAPQPVLAPLIGLALHDALRATWPKLTLALKAPNDVHAVTGDSARKLAGLLIEVVSGKELTVIVGLGLNVHGAPTGTTPFPATSLAGELGAAPTTLQWSTFLQHWTKGLEATLAEGPVSEMNRSACERLKAALQPHPLSRNLKDVRANGDLIFSDRTVAWSNL